MECICGGIIHIWKQGEQIWIEYEGVCDEEPVSEGRKEPTAIRPKQQLTNREIEAQARRTNKTQPETAKLLKATKCHNILRDVAKYGEIAANTAKIPANTFKI